MDQSDRLKRLLKQAKQALAEGRPKERRLRVVGSERAGVVDTPATNQCAEVIAFKRRNPESPVGDTQ